jgi:hypothetical protein
MATLGPLKPNLIDTWPETMLMIEAGTKNGEIRRGPRLTNSSCMLLNHRQATDTRADNAPDTRGQLVTQRIPGGKPASATAWQAAAMPEWMKESMCALLWECRTPYQIPLTSPAILQAKAPKHQTS